MISDKKPYRYVVCLCTVSFFFIKLGSTNKQKKGGSGDGCTSNT